MCDAKTGGTSTACITITFAQIRFFIMSAFQDVSIILPTMNETFSLRETMETLKKDCDGDIKEFIAVVCEYTTPESIEVCHQLEREFASRFKILYQKRPFLGGALQDAFEACTASHVIMMASDLETPPQYAKDFIREAKQHPDDVITGSRWAHGGKFIGYGWHRVLLNFIFQKFFSILYGVKLTDLTFGYRLLPRKLIQEIEWKELRFAFLFETILKPLRLGVKVTEVPMVWRPRSEGCSHNSVYQQFTYIYLGLKVRFMPIAKILKKENT